MFGRLIVVELGDAGSENPRLGIVEGILDPRFLIARHGDEFGSAEVVTDRPAHDAEARAERLGHDTILGEIDRARRRLRSEERRVGKECVSMCRSRWATYHYKKNSKKKH